MGFMASHTDADAIIQRLAALSSTSTPPSPHAQHDNAEGDGKREQLLALSYELVAALESPNDTLMRIATAEPARFAALRTAVDLDVFDRLKRAGEGGVSTAELASKAGAEGALVSRLMKHLRATHAVREVAPDVYASTPLADALASEPCKSGIVYNFDVALPAHAALPGFLRDKGFKDPKNMIECPFQAAHDTQEHFFPWIAGRPKLLASFGNWMGGYSLGRLSWGGFPVRERFAGVGSDRVALVDIGGGQGHDLAEFRARFPDVEGRLVLQDQASTLDRADGIVPTDVEVMAHDFFTEQPVKGAAAYHLHSVLHDWPREDCVRILGALRTAMTPGVSRVLINELVVPPRDAHWRVTGMDLLMMVLGAVRERTEGEWRAICEEAGLRVERVWYGNGGRESLIEAVRDD